MTVPTHLGSSIGAAPDPVGGRPSVRMRLLLFLLIPSLALLVLDSVFVYLIALHYSNFVHDRDLALSTIGLSRTLLDEGSDGQISRETSRLLAFNPEGHTFFSIRSLRHGLISGNLAIDLQKPAALAEEGSWPALYDATIDSRRVRASTLTIKAPNEAGDLLSISIAESLEDRKQRAREILLITIPVQALLIVAMLGLVWQGVRFGLRSLEGPVRRLASRKDKLAPISGPDIPLEILPLTQILDGLFARIRSLVALQERFVADAAHQLRTPLAGLSLNVERALSANRPEDRQEALRQVERLTSRVTRHATQLLTLARLQVPDEPARLEPLNLGHWLADVVAERVPDALQGAIDLGLEVNAEAALINADPAALQQLLDNLIDNAIRHAGKGGSITVGLSLDPVDSVVCLSLDDTGPGVPAEWLSRLTDRFFRAPDAPEGGSGLGLAIVQRIADAHGAALRFNQSSMGGLRVEVRFPDAGGIRP